MSTCARLRMCVCVIVSVYGYYYSTACFPFKLSHVVQMWWKKAKGRKLRRCRVMQRI